MTSDLVRGIRHPKGASVEQARISALGNESSAATKAVGRAQPVCLCFGFVYDVPLDPPIADLRLREVHLVLFVPGDSISHTSFSVRCPRTLAYLKDMDIAYQLLWRTQAVGEVTDLSCHELMHTLNRGRYALISAGLNHDRLRDVLEGAGYRVTPAIGNYAGSAEPMFMVHDPNERDMLALAAKYKQQSVVMAEGGIQRLIIVSGPNKGRTRASRGWSLATGREGNYTQIETTDGETVRFRLDF
jgi:hypothetical protein